VLRPVAACALPALAIAFGWASIEEPRQGREALLVAVLALAPALLPRRWQRAVAAAGAALVAGWVAFGVQPWELLPFREERVVSPVAGMVDQGIGDFYRVLLPFAPEQNPEMHALVLVAVFGFVLAAALLVASGRPLGGAAVTVAGAGWPATLGGDETIAVGALALAAALSIPLVLRVRTGSALVAGAAAAALVVGGAAWASTATVVAKNAALNWESWDFTDLPAQTTSVRFAWDSNYDGIRFPPTRTVVMTVDGPDEPLYWRASTLDLFIQDHWFEDHLWLGRVEDDGPMPLDGLTPRRALDPENWLEQRIEVKALVDDHLATAGTPIAVDSRRIGTVFRLSGGVLRVRDTLAAGQRYRVWSYAPDPGPAALAESTPRYPPTATRYLRVGSRVFPSFGTRGREQITRTMLADPAYPDFTPYQRMHSIAQRVVGDADTPYAAVLALESWFRQRGGFRYDELPPPTEGAPLVAFVSQTKAGYCQHYAGAMALMLRLLGVPARVAVGFTSGTREKGKWVVTDHHAHAWVEVWFAGHGWVPFDPTPGRGTFGGTYSFASNSEEAVARLGRGDLSGIDAPPDRRSPDPGGAESAGQRSSSQPSLVGLVLGLGTLWVLGVGLVKEIRRRGRYLTRDPRQTATASRRELESFLRDQGVAVPQCATLDDLRDAVHRELGLDGRRFVAAASSARFGPPQDARVRARAARRELRTLLKRARFELSLWARVRGFISLRSLRGGA
jgi:protein-glutamine gamma-glutamyltransferase